MRPVLRILCLLGLVAGFGSRASADSRIRSFGVRVDDMEDFGVEPDAELQALLDGLTPAR